MFKPLLAATLEDPKHLKFPCIVSPKLDGLRCIIRNGVAMSRNLKPFRNEFVQSQLKDPRLEGLDGELIVGSPTDEQVFNRSQSGVMSTDGEPDFRFHVFDHVDMFRDPFITRLNAVDAIKHPRLTLVPHFTVTSLEAFWSREGQFLDMGYEGVMIRSPNGRYKHGRSTLNEGFLIKFKRFSDSEGLVLDVLEGVHNANEGTRDALGEIVRSKHGANMHPSGQVGTLVVKDLHTEAVIHVSPGKLTHDKRKHFWENKHEILDRVIKYKHFSYGSLNAPRFPTFQDFVITE